MSQKSHDKDIGRRRFLTYLIGGVSGAIAAVVGVPLIGYFLSPAFRKSAPLLTPIARTGDIPPGTPTKIVYEQRVRDGWAVTTVSKTAWVMTGDGRDFIAFDPKCTHLNCPYYWDDKKQEFFCPCHNGRFDINGNVIGGPPPRPLDRLHVTIEGEDILVG